MLTSHSSTAVLVQAKRRQTRQHLTVKGSPCRCLSAREGRRVRRQNRVNGMIKRDHRRLAGKITCSSLYLSACGPGRLGKATRKHVHGTYPVSMETFDKTDVDWLLGGLAVCFEDPPAHSWLPDLPTPFFCPTTARPELLMSRRCHHCYNLRIDLNRLSQSSQLRLCDDTSFPYEPHKYPIQYSPTWPCSGNTSQLSTTSTLTFGLHWVLLKDGQPILRLVSTIISSWWFGADTYPFNLFWWLPFAWHVAALSTDLW